LRAHCRCTEATDRLIASAGWWQVTQARPLGPIAVKKGWPLVSIGPLSSSSRSVPLSFL
jgi:hypothetical protein